MTFEEYLSSLKGKTVGVIGVGVNYGVQII